MRLSVLLIMLPFSKFVEMNKLVSIVLLCLLIGCKKEPAPAPPAKVVKERKFKRDIKSLPIDSVFLDKYNDTKLASFYKAAGYGTVWIKPADRKRIKTILLKADDEGLLLRDYNVYKIIRYEAKVNTFSDEDMIKYDILLSATILKYMSHLAHGKLNPKQLYSDWDLKPDKLDIPTLLINGVYGDSLEKVIERCKPTHVVYKSLKKSLAAINKFPEDTIGEIKFTVKIIKNDTNNVLPRIKRRLMYWRDMVKADSITEIYDKQTFIAVKTFQERHGLSPDGIIGKGTVDALNFTKEKRRRQIIVNLERWRWYPQEMGNHYIIVNIPGYVLRVVKDNDTIERKRIVVGKAKRKTPILSSTFNNIVFNPTWTVPPTILKEDLTPSATKNRNYFAINNIAIYDYKGNAISSADWKPEKSKSYRYVQTPGDHNSLGNVKFNFPNHYTVYLHDTNHRDYFGRNYRSLSSGCVRVEDPLPLAQYILKDSINWSLEKIYEVIESKQTKIISLRQKIRLHQLYWTAWMDEYGDLKFREDIYNLDDALYNKLRQ